MEFLETEKSDSIIEKKRSLHAKPTCLFCFSHLRWDFVYQRPQHLISRFTNDYIVYFFEEPYFDATNDPSFTLHLRADNLWIVVPHLPPNLSADEIITVQKRLLDNFFNTTDLSQYVFWYYTPMAIPFTAHLHPFVTVYDCMDELSNFKFAPAEIKQYEELLFQKADVAFTGGHTLYQAKKNKHNNIHPFPSSIDRQHFMQARQIEIEPSDQQNIPAPRLGFYGVIDERFDLDLLREMAEQRPGWQFVILGPVVKIDPVTLPTLPNVHFLGGKSYHELPAYLSGWDVALIPFLINESTKYISPTKTPEYLSAGVPVISTPISDVVKPYGDEGLVKIASDAGEFINAAEELLHIDLDHFLSFSDEFLSKQSWDLTFEQMNDLVNKTIIQKQF